MASIVGRDIKFVERRHWYEQQTGVMLDTQYAREDTEDRADGTNHKPVMPIAGFGREDRMTDTQMQGWQIISR